MSIGGKSSRILFSSAVDVAPSLQSAREREFLKAADDGQTHLHVSTLEPVPTLGLGLFHRRPAAQPDIALWQRHTGGRAVACGRGFTIITLTLPHRAALVDVDRLALAPEQVMNRCVRGVLAALRNFGITPTYPGLDLVTHERRALAALSFLEQGGPTLFQAILAIEAPLSEGALLLDRADPDGLVPSNLIAASTAVALCDLVGSDVVREMAPGRLSKTLARAYEETFAIETEETAAPEIADSNAGTFLQEPPAPSRTSSRAQTNGLLGPVEAWASHAEGRIREFAICGDFIAPPGLPQRLAEHLQACPVQASAIQNKVESFLDKDESYLLGLTPGALVGLVQSAVGATV